MRIPQGCLEDIYQHGGLNPRHLIEGCFFHLLHHACTPMFTFFTVTYYLSLSYPEVGAPFGSVMYDFVGKMAPFLFLAVIAVLSGGTVEYCTQDEILNVSA